MIIFSIAWFLKVPVYRYGYSYFVSFLALGFAYLCILKNPIKSNAYSLLNFILISFTAIFILKNSIRIINPENINNKKNFPQIVFIKKSDIRKIELDNFYYFESTKMCGYSFPPCTNYINKKLKSKKYYNYKMFLVD